MKIGKLVVGKWLAVAIAVAGGALVAGIVVTARGRGHAAHAVADADYFYQCPMHPQIVQDKPGSCPICHMTLVKVAREKPRGHNGDGKVPAGKVAGVPGKAGFTLNEERRQLIGVKTGAVERRTLSRPLRLPGRVSGARRVTAELLEMDAGTVRAGMKATLSGSQEQKVDAVVNGVDSGFDALTRSYAVTLNAAEDAGWLKPGVYVEVDVVLDFGKRLAIPADAVLYSGERKVVFLTDGRGHFEPREVRLGKEGEDRVEVLAGLKEGDLVVTSANFLIDSESQFRAALEQYR